MRVRLLILLALFSVPVAPAPAAAVSVRDLVELARAGISDEVLIALIETDGTIFTLTADQIVELKAAGLADRVIITMLRQGRTNRPPSVTPGEAAPPTGRSTGVGVPAGMPPQDAWSADSASGRSVDPQPAQQAYAGGPFGAITTAPGTTVIIVPTVVPYPFFVPTHPPNCVRTPVATATAPRGFGRFINDGSRGRFINDGFRDGTPLRIGGPVLSACR